MPEGIIVVSKRDYNEMFCNEEFKRIATPADPEDYDIKNMEFHTYDFN